MSMLIDIDWTNNGNYNECFSNSEMMRDYVRAFALGHWSLLGFGEENLYCTTILHT